MRIIRLNLLVMLVVLLFGGHYLSAQEKGNITYEKDIQPLLSKNCLSCHGSDSPTITEFKKDTKGFIKKNKGPRMDTYENLMIFIKGSDTGALMRRLDDGKNTKDGKPGNMYKYLGDSGEERSANLSVIKKWVGGWTLKRRAEITEEELKAIEAPEK